MKAPSSQASSSRTPTTTIQSKKAIEAQVLALYELGLIPNPAKDPHKSKGKEYGSGYRGGVEPFQKKCKLFGKWHRALN